MTTLDLNECHLRHGIDAWLDLNDTRDMSTETTTAGGTLTLVTLDDKRLKRLNLLISTKTHPEASIPGCAVMQEMNQRLFTFFSTQKFNIDEELTLNFNVGSDSMQVQMKMAHLHEQISSGRIMTGLPTEENPFPARKFYRCFARVELALKNGEVIFGEAEGATLTTENNSDTATITDISAANSAATTETAPEEELKAA